MEKGVSVAQVILSGVNKAYGGGGIRVEVIRNMNLEIFAGEFLAITGPSGAGKSTLLNIVGGIDRPDSGRVTFEGTEIGRMSEGQLAKWRSRHVGFVFQFYNLIPVLNAAQNIEIPLLLRDLSRDERRRQVAVALELVGLADRARHKPSQLSGGQQQRVAIARAIVSDPKLLICDEPTGDLDQDSSDSILTLLRLLSVEHGKTIAMVTHDSRAAGFASRELRIEKSRAGSEFH